MSAFDERLYTLQTRLDPDWIVFVDETRVKTNMTPAYGRARRGQRVPGRAPHGHWQTSTFIGALRSTRLIAPAVFDGPMNGRLFRVCVAQILAPTLRPGEVVVLDNLGAHKSRAVRAAIEAKGASLLFLPPTRPTSTRSKRPSPSSRPSSGGPKSVPSMPSGTASASFSTASRPANAPTSSPTPAMRPNRWTML